MSDLVSNRKAIAVSAVGWLPAEWVMSIHPDPSLTGLLDARKESRPRLRV